MREPAPSSLIRVRDTTKHRLAGIQLGKEPVDATISRLLDTAFTEERQTKDDNPMVEDLVFGWILKQKEHPGWTRTILAFGVDNLQMVERTLGRLLDQRQIIKDGDLLIVTGGTSPKLEKLMRERIPLEREEDEEQ